MTTADESHEFTEREWKVIREVCRGLSNLEIAKELGIMEPTVMKCICSIFGKARISNRLELVVFVKTAFPNDFTMQELNAELRRRSGRGESA